jgi:tRNA dimethylallyltransferase
LPAIRAVGYRQVWQHLNGELDFDQMREKAIVATRQLAKRQFTWLRKQGDAIRLSSETGRLAEQVQSVLHSQYAK